MILEARSPSCWSDLYLLKLDGRPWGEYRGRWFSECVDAQFTGRHRLRLEKKDWLGSRFVLTDAGNDRTLAEADRSGVFTSAWDLRLSKGASRLVSAGWLNTAYRVFRGDRAVAEVDRIGFCNLGWTVEDDGSLGETDLLFIGLIYHTILRRNAAAAAAVT
jgi:hypothetical protein